MEQFSRNTYKTLAEDLKYLKGQERSLWDFPGGAVVKNSPANGQGTQVQAPVQEDPPYAVEQLSPCATTTEPAL